MLGNPADAEDVVSDAVTDAWMTIGKLRSEEAFDGWVFRILSNKKNKIFGREICIGAPPAANP